MINFILFLFVLKQFIFGLFILNIVNSWMNGQINEIKNVVIVYIYLYEFYILYRYLIMSRIINCDEIFMPNIGFNIA